MTREISGYGSNANGKITIRGIMFDYGNVLSHPQDRSDIEEMAQICGLETACFQNLYWRFRPPYDRGDLDGNSYWKRLAEEAGVVFSLEQIQRLIPLDAKSWSRKNEATLAWVAQLREAGIRLELLSNMPAEISQWLSAHCDWLHLFDHLTFSCDVRSVKPDPAIYQACLDKIQLPPKDVLMLDDRADNVEGAMALGIHGMLFDTMEKTAARVVERFDLPALGLARL